MSETENIDKAAFRILIDAYTNLRYASNARVRAERTEYYNGALAMYSTLTGKSSSAVELALSMALSIEDTPAVIQGKPQTDR
jgi:hypothetical protein